MAYQYFACRVDENKAKVMQPTKMRNTSKSAWFILFLKSSEDRNLCLAFSDSKFHVIFSDNDYFNVWCNAHCSEIEKT